MSVGYLPNENNLPVCVIHDELSIRESHSSHLRSAGLNVQTFSSLAQARLYAELARANEDLKRETNERQRVEAELHKSEVSLREAQIELPISVEYRRWANWRRQLLTKLTSR